MTSGTATADRYFVCGDDTTHPDDNAPSVNGLRRHAFYIYLVRNSITGTNYVGQHRSNPDEDWRHYMGSGSYLRTEARAYGVENFSKQLLAWADTALEAKFLEARFIAKALDKPTYCYNSNQSEAVRRDPADNLRHFAFKASFRGRERLRFNIALTDKAIASGLDHSQRDDLEELREGWHWALRIKDERFTATGQLDPKDWAELRWGFDPDDSKD